MEERRKPLGIFDSGLGGLTALRELKALCPGEDIVYFGDTGRVPYGTKSAVTIKKYALQDTAFLKSLGVKAILAACGTVSANAMDVLSDGSDICVMGVIEPTVKRASELTEKGGTVLILGTEATVESRSYERVLCELRPDIKVRTKACPMFVPLVENGFTDPSHPAVSAIVHEYLDSFAADTDTVILGCTHYPLLADAIKGVLKNAAVVNSGAAAALCVKDYLEKNGLSNRDGGSVKIYVSDGVRNFERIASAFMGCPVSGVEKASVENF